MSPEEIALLYMDKRAVELSRLWNYVHCKQYEDRKVGWFDNASETPLFERKPCINYPITKNAIGSHVAFCLGEGRFPYLTSAPNEDDEEIDEDWGLNEDDSAVLDRFVNVVLCKYANLRTVARQMLAEAMGSKSAAAIVSVQQGRVVVETARAGWCTPELDVLGNVVKLEIRYPFFREVAPEPGKKLEKTCFLYRRIIDAFSDTVFKEARARQDGREPTWTVNASKSRPHGLGFCPVVWYPCLRSCATSEDVDGHAIHESQLGEIDCLNISLSQKQRASTVAGDPQLIGTGVEEGYNPAPTGRAARTVIASDPQGISGYRSQPVPNQALSATVRKRGAGSIWSYTSEKADAKYLAIPTGAIQSIDEHAKDLRTKISEAMSAVFVDPTDVHSHAAMSGKALSFVFSRQLAFDDVLRDDFATRGLLPLVSMLLRVVYVIGKQSSGALYMPGVKKVVPVLESFERSVEGTDATAWLPPRLEPQWGPYFDANEQDQLFVVQLIIAALQGGIITTEMAVQKLSTTGLFEIGSAELVVEAIEKERADKQAAAVEQAKAMATVQPPDAQKTPPGKPAFGAQPSKNDKKPKTKDEKKAA